MFPEHIADRLIDMAVTNVKAHKGGPFSCIITDGHGNEIGSGCNEVTKTNDPTAHAEIVALRVACQTLDNFRLPPDAVVFTSCEPCPMCKGALMWAGARSIVYVATRDDAHKAGFDDKRFYDEWSDHSTTSMSHLDYDKAFVPFTAWMEENDKIHY